MPPYANHDADLGSLIATPFGAVSDEALADQIELGDASRYVAPRGDGGIDGSVVRPSASFDLRSAGDPYPPARASGDSSNKWSAGNARARRHSRSVPSSVRAGGSRTGRPRFAHV